MIAEIIGIGAKLEQEEALNSSTRLIAGELESCGIEIRGKSAVGSDAARLRAAVAKALGRSDVVILLGGMGFGPDGITKETICQGIGRRLVLHEDSLRRIKAAYAHAGRQMPQQAIRLAMLPEKSVVFPGVRGVTPGCALSAGNQFMIMMPENPQEFVPMMQRSIVPYLAKFSAAAVEIQTVNLFGMEAADAERKLGTILSSKNPSVAIYAKRGELQIRVTTRAKTKVEAASIGKSVIQEIRRRLGSAVYGVDAPGLMAVTFGLLRQQHLTIAVGESGTGGMFAGMAAQLGAGPELIRLGVSASNDKIKQESLSVPEKTIKKHGSVSGQVASAMAAGALRQGQASLGTAICGEPGEDDGRNMGRFYIAVCDQDSVWVRELTIPASKSIDEIRYQACLELCNLLRQYVIVTPQALPGGVPLKTALSGKLPENAIQQGNTEKQSKKRKSESEPKKKRGFFKSVFPAKGDSGGDVVRKMILIVAVLVFVSSASYLGYFYLQSANNKKITADIQDMYIEGMEQQADPEKIEVPDNYPKGYQKKFVNLYQINEDVIGWLKIEDTQLNYPVVHYTDNDYYLRRDFYRNNNKHGIPWLDFNNTVEPQSDNYVIYGHNMTDGQMFGELMKYKGENGLEFLKAHPIISFDDVYRDNDYKIFSVFITNADTAYGEIFYYNTFTDFKDDAEFNAYVEEVRARSYYDSDVDVKPGDQLLTLSTCSYEFGPTADTDTRTVIVARRVRAGEKADGSDINYQWNPDYKLPEGFRTGGGAQQTAAPATTTQPVSSAQPSSSEATSTQYEPVPDVSEESTVGSSVDAGTGESLTPEQYEELQYQQWLAASQQQVQQMSYLAAASSKAASDAAASKAAADAAASKAASDAAKASSEAKEREEGDIYEPTVSVRPSGNGDSDSGYDEDDEDDYDDEDYSGGWDDRLSIIAGGKKLTGDADDIVAQVVMNEMGASFNKEALKAQAVAVYSFIKHQNKSGVTPYLGVKTPSSTVKNAVQAVAGEAVYYRGGLAFTPFYATSAGVTCASSDVWGGHYDYLISVDSDVDEEARNFETSVTLSADSVASKVEKALGIDLYDYSDDPDDWFQIKSYTDGDRYVKNIRVGSKTTTGRILRENVLGLRSAAFEIDYRSSSDKFVFTTYGYGHGVGMSQTGANLYAAEGWDYIDILTHYYPGTTVK